MYDLECNIIIIIIERCQNYLILKCFRIKIGKKLKYTTIHKFCPEKKLRGSSDGLVYNITRFFKKNLSNHIFGELF